MTVPLVFLALRRARTPLCPWRIEIADSPTGPHWKITVEPRFGRPGRVVTARIDGSDDEREELHGLGWLAFDAMAREGRAR